MKFLVAPWMWGPKYISWLFYDNSLEYFSCCCHLLLLSYIYCLFSIDILLSFDVICCHLLSFAVVVIYLLLFVFQLTFSSFFSFSLFLTKSIGWCAFLITGMSGIQYTWMLNRTLLWYGPWKYGESATCTQQGHYSSPYCYFLRWTSCDNHIPLQLYNNLSSSHDNDVTNLRDLPSLRDPLDTSPNNTHHSEVVVHSARGATGVINNKSPIALAIAKDWGIKTVRSRRAGTTELTWPFLRLLQRQRRWVRVEVHRRIAELNMTGKYIGMHIRHGNKQFGDMTD